MYVLNEREHFINWKMSISIFAKVDPGAEDWRLSTFWILQGKAYQEHLFLLLSPRDCSRLPQQVLRTKQDAVMYSQGVLGASSMLIEVSENVVAVSQQPLGPNPAANGMDWISHPIFNHSDPVVYFSRWAIMKVIVGIHGRRPLVGVRSEVRGHSWVCPRLYVQRKKIFLVFSKISALYTCDFYNLNTGDECLLLNIKTKNKKTLGR